MDVLHQEANKSWGRSIAAVIVGYIILIAAPFILGVPLNLLITIPLFSPLISSSIDQLATTLIDLHIGTVIAILTLFALVPATIAGYVTALIARRAEIKHAIALAVLPAIPFFISLIVLIATYGGWGDAGEFVREERSGAFIWIPVGFAPLPGALLGGYIRILQKRRKLKHTLDS